MGYNSVANNMGLSSFVVPLLVPKSAKFRDNSNYSRSRSSNVIDLGVSQKRICNFLLVTKLPLIVTLVINSISYCFRGIDV